MPSPPAVHLLQEARGGGVLNREGVPSGGGVQALQVGGVGARQGTRARYTESVLHAVCGLYGGNTVYVTQPARGLGTKGVLEF